ncbi:MAG: hypothetical protein A2845_05970 [Candidatus Lloydbacteria bacterium RIFCSPHIGHO2_01_FULL_49_22]|uniref:Uncharacterized protein n=1 Tax=Candidatus Lloydbacteria bacterium RIFCSPHIGHO2_01_FULL_49_22 TaxID=1798658 RepID=A0A1G2CVX6_9BACT|nr:MAG: hypothetical protein A2845_05970 [Candidatus Lloydbacteria bacterium RIFCSPHIGHO2_01_FULL_49_22]OGZ09774.1 MAG: hypothetical protein A3C14_00045 [Candidatus Lloydbacteria bacterium RIFCSPHIGHO2_02_FULL_50_18]
MASKHPTVLEKRIDAQKEKVIEFLAESGNISFACKRGGISRETYYRWRDDARFAAKADSAIQSGKTFVNDLAHTQLIRKIQEGDMQAIRFHLVNCHDDYRPKLPERIERVVPITAVEIIQASHDCKKEVNAE